MRKGGIIPKKWNVKKKKNSRPVSKVERLNIETSS